MVSSIDRQKGFMGASICERRLRHPRRHRKLTMLIPATSENVAPRHCSDEREVNSQKPERAPAA